MSRISEERPFSSHQRKHGFTQALIHQPETLEYRSPIRREVVRLEVISEKPAAGERQPSSAHLKETWKTLVHRYFPHRLDLLEYTVVWSGKRQKRTLASCNILRKRIAVAQELKVAHLTHWLDPLLYHEMCHAVLGENVGRDRRGRKWHGAQFKRLESQHPGIALLDAWIKAGGGQQRFEAIAPKKLIEREKSSKQPYS